MYLRFQQTHMNRHPFALTMMHSKVFELFLKKKGFKKSFNGFWGGEYYLHKCFMFDFYKIYNSWHTQ